MSILLGNGDGTFTTKSTPSVGRPFGMAVGDFNGDGIPDLAVANYERRTVSILLGNGDGIFTVTTSPHFLYGIPSLMVADFNGDGIEDLVATSSLEENLAILLGNGDGTFTRKSTPSVGYFGNPQSAAVGDFNGDGIPDLAVVNYTNGYPESTFIILLGNGDGTFTTKLTPDVGNGPQGVAVGDFNRDGIPDLAVTNSTDGTVSILLGNGDGTFTTKSTPAVGSVGEAMAVGDFNGDGIPDLAVSNYGYGTGNRPVLRSAYYLKLRDPSAHAHHPRARYGARPRPHHPGATVLVAVSGGADSMALLHALGLLRGELASVFFAHGVDHGLRAPAAAELDLAERFARSLDVPFGRTQVEVAAGGDLQARARDARWQALRTAAARVGATQIATGHHADDRAETLLMRILRGSRARQLGVLPTSSTAIGSNRCCRPGGPTSKPASAVTGFRIPRIHRIATLVSADAR